MIARKNFSTLGTKTIEVYEEIDKKNYSLKIIKYKSSYSNRSCTYRYSKADLNIHQIIESSVKISFKEINEISLIYIRGYGL